jgi:hypothetical protein
MIWAFTILAAVTAAALADAAQVEERYERRKPGPSPVPEPVLRVMALLGRYPRMTLELDGPGLRRWIEEHSGVDVEVTARWEASEDRVGQAFDVDFGDGWIVRTEPWSTQCLDEGYGPYSYVDRRNPKFPHIRPLETTPEVPETAEQRWPAYRDEAALRRRVCEPGSADGPPPGMVLAAETWAWLGVPEDELHTTGWYDTVSLEAWRTEDVEVEDDVWSAPTVITSDSPPGMPPSPYMFTVKVFSSAHDGHERKPVGSIEVIRTLPNELLGDCGHAVEEIRHRYGQALETFMVAGSHVDHSAHDRGYGVVLYLAAAREAARRGGMLIRNDCIEPNATSAQATRVWRSRELAEHLDVVEGTAAYPKDGPHMGDDVWERTTRGFQETFS